MERRGKNAAKVGNTECVHGEFNRRNDFQPHNAEKKYIY